MNTQYSNTHMFPHRRRLLGLVFMALPILALLCEMGWLITAKCYPPQSNGVMSFLDFLGDIRCIFQKYAIKSSLLLLLPLFFCGAWLTWRPLQVRSFLLCGLAVGCFTIFLWMTLQPFGIIGNISSTCFLLVGMMELYTLFKPDKDFLDMEARTALQYPQRLGWLLVFAPFLLALAGTVHVGMQPVHISVTEDAIPSIPAVWHFLKLLGFTLPLLFPVCYCGWRLLLARHVSGKLWLALTGCLLLLGLILFLGILTMALKG